MPAKDCGESFKRTSIPFSRKTRLLQLASSGTLSQISYGQSPKLASYLDDARDDVLAFTTLPKAHRTQLASTNPLERVNAEIKRRTDVAGMFPNDAAIVRLVDALLLE